jgi:thiosulfate reductase cytochrome b subunit
MILSLSPFNSVYYGALLTLTGIYMFRLSQLPFLDVKIEYVWGSYQINDVVRNSTLILSLAHVLYVMLRRPTATSMSFVWTATIPWSR